MPPLTEPSVGDRNRAGPSRSSCGVAGEEGRKGCLVWQHGGAAASPAVRGVKRRTEGPVTEERSQQEAPGKGEEEISPGG